MKSSQSSSVVALAVLLAATVILMGRLLGPSESVQEQTRLTALTPGSKLTYLTNVRRDQAEIVVLTVDKSGIVRQLAQQRVRFQTSLPRLDIAQNGTLLLQEGMLTNVMTHVRSIYDYDVQLSVPNCQFAALSPDGRTVACASGTGVMVSPTNRLQWTNVRIADKNTQYGAPRLFNQTIVLPRAIHEDTEMLVVSLSDNRTLATLWLNYDYVFNHNGTHAVLLEDDEVKLLSFLSGVGCVHDYDLPEELEEYTVQPVALSDGADRVLLQVEHPGGGATQMVVWELASDELTWLNAVEMTGRATANFHPDGTMVTFAIGQSIYVASLTDGQTYWVGRGLNPVWIVR